MPTKLLYGAETTFVASSEPNTNFRSQNTISCGYAGGSSGRYLTQAFIRFADDRFWDAIPNGARVLSGELLVFAREIYGDTQTTHGLGRNDTGWNPENLTWNNRDSSFYAIGTFKARQGQVSEIPCTDYVRSAASTLSLRSRGLRLTTTTSGYGRRTNFDAASGSYRPRLRVTYDAADPAQDATTVNAPGNGVSLTGGGVDGAARVEVSRWPSSAIENGVNLGNATSNGDRWALFDKPPLPAPNAPGNLRASESSPGVVVLSWNHASQNSRRYFYRARRFLSDGTVSGPWAAARAADFTPNRSSYIVYRSENGGAFREIARVSGVSATYTDRSAESGAVYRYYVRATNTAEGTSPASNFVQVSTLSVEAPNPYTLEIVSLGSGLPTDLSEPRLFRIAGTVSQDVVDAGGDIRIYASPSAAAFGEAPDSSFSLARMLPATSRNFDTATSNGGNIDAAPPVPPAPVFRSGSPTVSGERLVFSWQQPASPSIVRHFRLTSRVGATESSPSLAQRAEYRPSVKEFVLSRRVRGSDQPFTEVYRGGLLYTEDARGVPGVEYEYRLSAVDFRAKQSTPAYLTAKYPLLAAPTDVLAERMESDRGPTVRISGSGYLGADAVVVERKSSGATAWTRLGEATAGSVPDRPDGLVAEWRISDEPALAAPERVKWVGSSTSRSGVSLLWDRPAVPASDYDYRAHRVLGFSRGTDSGVSAIRLVSEVVEFVLERREVLEGQEGAYTTIARLTEQRYTDPVDDEDPDALNTESVYEYRVRAAGQRGAASIPSLPRRVETYRLPEEAPPPAEASPPTLSNPRPGPSTMGELGVVEVRSSASGASTIAVRYDYADARTDGSGEQDSYTLQITRQSPEGETETFYWSGRSWVSGEVTVRSALTNPGAAPASGTPVPGTPGQVYSGQMRIEVPARVPFASGEEDGSFSPGVVYTFTVVARSRAGGVSEELSWDFTVARVVRALIATRRLVSKHVQTSVSTLRRVTSNSAAYRKGLIVEWRVAPRLPALPGSSEGVSGDSGETIRPWQVSNASGRPEPYAELDFQQGSFTKTFYADERGRIQIRLPTDLSPGIYTVRERGPAMAPRTYDNVPITDPWAVYHHASRHSGGGEDPVLVGDAQVREGAGIRPEKVAGAAGLANLITRFGPDILKGIERHVSSGHASYVVRGLAVTDASSDGPEGTSPALRVEGGSAWENGRYREIAPLSVPLRVPEGQGPDGSADAVVYRVYVESGRVVASENAFFPLLSVPLATATVELVPDEGGEEAPGTRVSISDARTTHPARSEAGDAVPVISGATRTTEIEHSGEVLSDVIDTQAANAQGLRTEQRTLSGAFEASVTGALRAIEEEEGRRMRARSLLLATSTASRLASLLAAMEGSPYVPTSPDLVAFRRGEPLSSLSEVVVDTPSSSGSLASYSPAYLRQALAERGEEGFIAWVGGLRGYAPGRAVLPEGFSARETYALRTLRIPVAPSSSLRLVVVYEEEASRDARFSVDGSLATGGRYSPKAMPLTRQYTVPDPVFSEETLLVDTYDTHFGSPGDEAVLSLRIRGGTAEEGVAVRGIAVVSA